MIFDRISDYIPPQMKILPMVNPKSNALLQIPLKVKCCKPHKAAHHPRICEVLMTSNYFR